MVWTGRSGLARSLSGVKRMERRGGSQPGQGGAGQGVGSGMAGGAAQEMVALGVVARVWARRDRFEVRWE